MNMPAFQYNVNSRLCTFIFSLNKTLIQIAAQNDRLQSDGEFSVQLYLHFGTPA